MHNNGNTKYDKSVWMFWDLLRSSRLNNKFYSNVVPEASVLTIKPKFQNLSQREVYLVSRLQMLCWGFSDFAEVRPISVNSWSHCTEKVISIFLLEVIFYVMSLFMQNIWIIKRFMSTNMLSKIASTSIRIFFLKNKRRLSLQHSRLAVAFGRRHMLQINSASVLTVF